jgi:hypothetical protein
MPPMTMSWATAARNLASVVATTLGGWQNETRAAARGRPSDARCKGGQGRRPSAKLLLLRIHAKNHGDTCPYRKLYPAGIKLRIG